MATEIRFLSERAFLHLADRDVVSVSSSLKKTVLPRLNTIQVWTENKVTVSAWILSKHHPDCVYTICNTWRHNCNFIFIVFTLFPSQVEASLCLCGFLCWISTMHTAMLSHGSSLKKVIRWWQLSDDVIRPWLLFKLEMTHFKICAGCTVRLTNANADTLTSIQLHALSGFREACAKICAHSFLCNIRCVPFALVGKKWSWVVTCGVSKNDVEETEAERG